MNREGILKMSGGPVAKVECDGETWKRAKLNMAGLKLPNGTKLYTEAQLLQTAQTAYAKGAADMKERAAEICVHERDGGMNDGDLNWSDCAKFIKDKISYLSITQAASEGERV